MKSCSIYSFIPILWLVATTLAEPPVGDGYPSGRPHDHQHGHDHHDHDHHGSEHQASNFRGSDHDSSNHHTEHPISQEYGPLSGTARNAPNDGYQYNSPNARSQNGRGQSRFPPATVRVSFNQRFSSAASRNSNPSARRQQSAPNARVSQEYGPPASRSLSQEYGAPSMSARTLSTEYGMPDARSTPSQEYGVPVLAARSQNQKPSNFRGALSHSTHENTSTRSQFQADSQSHGYSASSARSSEVSEGYEGSKSFGARTAPSSTYGAPSSHSSKASSRSSDSVSVDSASETYGTPSQSGLDETSGAPSQTVDETYGVPSARGVSQEYEVSGRSNLMTSAVPSSVSTSAASPSSRSAPSSSYLPASRASLTAPADQYGVPEQRDGAQGYDYARARALEELQNQEPASYDFGYQIEDQESGSDFGHSETREENKAQGSYFVVRPDGSKQTVDYEADERGFKPRISVEPAAGAGGYDKNAQDLTRAQGPY